MMAFFLIILAGAERASAEFFTFLTTVAPPTTTTAGNVTVTLTPLSVNTPGDNLDASPIGTDIVFGSISVTGLTQTSPLEAINIPYTFQIAITDYDTGTDGSPDGGPVIFNVSGTLTGSVGANKKVNIANAFAQTSITQLVGSENYRVNLFSYVAPGVVNDGRFGAHVEVVPIPEPGTLALLSVGFMTLATPAFRRRQRNTPRPSGSR
jgi:hypothetical protein